MAVILLPELVKLMFIDGAVIPEELRDLNQLVKLNKIKKLLKHLLSM